MNKGALRGIILCLIAVIVTVVFIVKSNTDNSQGNRSTVTISNNSTDTNNTYVEAKTDDNIIDYAQNHYFAIILFSTMSFFGLLIFYAFLSKKKEW